MNLIEILSNAISPTWNNVRCDAAGLAKRLDRFLLAEDLCHALGNYMTWSHALGFSYHKAILLQLDFNKRNIVFSFKFNLIWLEDKSFCELVKEKWSSWLDIHFSSKLAWIT